MKEKNIVVINRFKSENNIKLSDNLNKILIRLLQLEIKNDIIAHS